MKKNVNFYNIICSKENLEGLYITMYNKVFRDENDYLLKNHNFLLYFNNIAMVAYINTKNIIHLKALKEGYEVILKEIKTSQDHVYKYELKEVKSTLINPRKEMEMSYNFNIAMNNKPELIELWKYLEWVYTYNKTVEKLLLKDKKI